MDRNIFRKADEKLGSELAVDEYLELYESISGKQYNLLTASWLKSKLLEGYLAKGYFEKATQEFLYLRKNYSAISKPLTKTLALKACIDYCIYTYQLQEIDFLFAELNNAINMVTKKQDALIHEFEVLRMQYLLLTNQQEGIERFSEICNDIVRKEYPFCTLVELHYFAGIYYEQNGRFEEAANAYRFVAENGKDLYIAFVSRQKAGTE